MPTGWHNLVQKRGFFCKNPPCEVVYFHPEKKQRVNRDQIETPRTEDGEKILELVCYCFKYSLSDLEVDVQETGRSSIPNEIEEKCQSGLDDCERKNPSGRCCLGTVREMTKTLKRKYGVTAESGIFPEIPDEDTATDDA